MWVKGHLIGHIQEEMEIKSNHTGTDWNSFAREVVIYGSFQSNLTIGGPGLTVEIDETKLGKRKYNRGHHVEGQWVFGGVERGSGKCFMVPVEDRSRSTLMALIKRYIRPGSTIISDFWKVRICLTKVLLKLLSFLFQSYDSLTDEGYTHWKVNHSLSFKDPITGEHTNTIEGLWRHLKSSVPEYNRRSHFFNGYVQKFIFLRWCKANNLNPFLQFMKFAGQLYNPLQKSPETGQVQDMARDDLLLDFSDEECSSNCYKVE